MSDDNDGTSSQVVRFNVPNRYYLIPGAAIIVGTMIGLVRGSRTASLRFLAENVHRPPETVQGWYFYQKTKNYRVLMGGLKAAGADALRLGTTAVGWVGIEEGCKKMGWEDFQEIAAGAGTAGVFSAVYRLPWKASSRALVLGLMMGTAIRGLRWSQDHLQELREHAARREAEIEAEAEKTRKEILEDVGAVVPSENR